MNFNKFYLILFFAAIVGLIILLTPLKFDLISVYKNAEDFNQASEMMASVGDGEIDKVRLELEKARLFFAKGEYPKTYDILVPLSDENPENKEIWETLINVSKASFNRKQLIRAYEGYLDISPADKNMMIELSDLYRLSQIPDKAFQVSSKLKNSYPKERRFWKQVHEYYLQSNQIEPAIDSLYKYIQLFPKDNKALESLISLLVHQNREDEAVLLSRTRLIYVSQDPFVLIKFLNLFLKEQNQRDVSIVCENIIKLKEGKQLLYDVAESHNYSYKKTGLAIFTWLTEKYPTESRMHKGYIHSQVVNGNDSKALDSYRKNFRKGKSFKKYMTGLLDFYYTEKNTEERVAHIDKTLGDNPLIEAQLIRAYTYELNKEPEKSTEILAALVKKYPQNRYLTDSYLNYLESASKPIELIVTLEEALEKWPNDEGLHFQLGKRYVWADFFLKAIKKFEFLNDSYPGKLDYNYFLALSYLNQGFYIKASEEFKILTEKKYTTSPYVESYVYTIESLADKDVALDHARKLNEALGYKNAKALYLLGRMLYETDQKQEAHRVFAQLTSLDLGAEQYAYFGWMKLYDEEYKAARKDFFKALKLEPDHLKALNGLAQLNIQKRPKSTKQYLERMHELNPQEMDILYDMGALYKNLNMKTRSHEYYNKFLSKINDVKEVHAYFYEQKVSAYFNTDQVKTAFLKIEEAKKIYPNKSIFWLLEAEYLMELKRYNSALDVLVPLKHLNQKDQSHRLSMMHECYYELKDWKKLKEILHERILAKTDDTNLRFELLDALKLLGEYDQALLELKALKHVPDLKYVARQRILEIENSLYDSYGTRYKTWTTLYSLGEESMWEISGEARLFPSPKKQYHIRVSQFNGSADTVSFSSQTLKGTYRHHISPQWFVDVSTGFYTKVSALMLEAKTHYNAFKWGMFELGTTQKKQWIQPLLAAKSNGTFDKHWINWSVTLPKKYFGRVQTYVKSYYFNKNESIGDENKTTFVVGRTVYENIDDVNRALKYVSIDISHSQSSTTQIDSSKPTLDISGRSKVTSIQLYLHYLFQDDQVLDVSLVVGGDTLRQVPFGKLYGMSIKYQKTLQYDRHLFSEFQYFSETPSQTKGGAFWEIKAGLNIRF